jgi:hypothetical protein
LTGYLPHPRAGQRSDSGSHIGFIFFINSSANHLPPEY